jgi:hypothetical protein
MFGVKSMQVSSEFVRMAVEHYINDEVLNRIGNPCKVESVRRHNDGSTGFRH